jgi:hypothetical protein
MKTLPISHLRVVHLLTVVSLFVGELPVRGAVDRVIYASMAGRPLKYHTAIDNQSVRLKGVIRTTDNATSGIDGVWGWNGIAGHAVFGWDVVQRRVGPRLPGRGGDSIHGAALVDPVDGSMVNALADPYLIKLEEAGLDARINIAIDNGLWFLHKNQYSHSNLRTFSGAPDRGLAPDQLRDDLRLADGIRNPRVPDQRSQAGREPGRGSYVTNVRNGFNWLFSGYYLNSNYPMLRSVAIGPSTARIRMPTATARASGARLRRPPGFIREAW